MNEQSAGPANWWEVDPVAPSQGAPQAAPAGWEADPVANDQAPPNDGRLRLTISPSGTTAPQPEAPAPQQPETGGWNNATAGLNEAIYTTLGAPVDLAAGVVNLGMKGVEKLTGAEMPRVRDPIGGSRSIARAMTTIGVNDPEQVKPDGAGETILRKAGEGVGYMIAPEAMLGAMAKAGIVGESAMRFLGALFGESKTAANVAGNAAIGGVAGATGEAAGQVADETGAGQFRPLADFAGNMAGGAVAAGVAALPRAVMAAADRANSYALATPLAQERAAAERLQTRATDPRAAVEAIDTAPRELIPGSEPTTFQLTGDMGLGEVERGVRTQNPGAFQQRTADQNIARREALDTIQPTGYPEQVSQALREQLARLDADTEAAISGATTRAVEGTRALGGDLPPEAYGAALRDIERPIVQAAEGDALAAMRGIGGEGFPEVYGAGLRGRLVEARDAAKARERQLWDAVDPDGSLTLPATDTRSVTRAMLADMPALAKPPSGEEASLLAAAGQIPEVVPFRELTALRSRVSEAMSQARLAGENLVYGRLSQLRGAIERDIDNAVANKAAMEEQAVRAGVMSEEDTLAALLTGWRNGWQEQQASRAGVGAGAGPDAAGGASGFHGPRGSPSQGRGQFPDAPGAEGVQGYRGLRTDLEPNIDEGAAGRLKEASAATKDRARTYDEGPVGDVLAGPTKDAFTVADVSVPGRIFRPGLEGFHTVRAFRKAVGDDAAAIHLLQQAAVADLRRTATRPNGTLDPDAYGRWRAKYADAIRAFPDFLRSIGTAERASRLLDDARIIPEGVLDGDVGGKVFRSGPGGYESVTNFVRALGDDRARTILQDYAINRLRDFAEVKSGDLAGTLDPKKVEMWRARHKDALRALPEVDRMLADPWAASEAIANLATIRKEALDGFQSGVVARLLNVESPQDVTRIVGGLFEKQDAVRQLRKLVAETRGNPDAREGLRKAVADYINTRFVSNTEGATTEQTLIRADQFQTFVRKNDEALRAVLTDREVNMLGLIAADLARANRSNAAVRVPGQSNTAQDLAESAKQNHSVLSHLITPQALGGAGVIGAATGISSTGGLGLLGAAGIQWLRNRGIKNVDALVLEAMLNPDIARKLLTRVDPKKPGPSINFAQTMARVGAEGAATSGGR